MTATRTNRHAVTPIDGWLDTTRGIYGGGIDALQESWGACEEVTVTTGSTSTLTWTEEELCTRHISPGFYSETTVLSHDVEAEVVTTAHTFTVPLHHTLAGWVNVVTGAGELDIRGRERCDIPDPGGDGPPTRGWCATRETVAISITPPGAGALCSEGGPEIVGSMELDFYGDGRINRVLAEAIIQHPDCEDPVMRFTTGPAMWDHYRTRYLTRFGVGLGRNWFRLHTRAIEITKDEWGPPEVLANILGAEERGCTPTIIDISSYRDGNCYDAGGVAICPGTAQGDALSPAPFDPDELRTSRFGSEYRISYASCLPPVKPGESCAPLAEDPACLYVDSSIIEGALGEDQLAEDRYICERSRDVEDELASTSLKCPSGIRGVGDDLITIENEEPASLASVAAHLSAAQMLAADTDCGVDEDAGESLAECRIFKGQRRTCKRSIWGIVDCCRNPGAHVSLREYLQLMFRMAELAGKAGATYATNTADSLVNHPFTAGYPPEALIEMIYLNNVNTTLGEALTDPSPDVMADLLDAARQDMMNQTAMWTRGVFGHEMAGTMFLEAGGAISAIGTLSTISFAPQFKTDGSMAVNVMAAFGLYEVTALLASLIWECNDSEMHLHVQRELDSCHYVGSYCSDRNFFGGCNTRRRAYCCFSSPLAR
ncbi:MAG: conjugal transfer protein TraN, partial [Pseudomonadota bacterium]